MTNPMQDTTTFEDEVLFEEVGTIERGPVSCHHYVADEEEETEQDEVLFEEVGTIERGPVSCHHYVADEEEDESK